MKSRKTMTGIEFWQDLSPVMPRYRLIVTEGEYQAGSLLVLLWTILIHRFRHPAS